MVGGAASGVSAGMGISGLLGEKGGSAADSILKTAQGGEGH
jgi:hypothetical protein